MIKKIFDIYFNLALKETDINHYTYFTYNEYKQIVKYMKTSILYRVINDTIDIGTGCWIEAFVQAVEEELGDREIEKILLEKS